MYQYSTTCYKLSISKCLTGGRCDRQTLCGATVHLGYYSQSFSKARRLFSLSLWSQNNVVQAKRGFFLKPNTWVCACIIKTQHYIQLMLLRFFHSAMHRNIKRYLLFYCIFVCLCSCINMYLI